MWVRPPPRVPVFARNEVKSEDCRAVAEGEGGHVAPFDQRATYDKPAKNRMKFFYVYILQSETATETFYVGFTEDLRSRLKIHNSGQVPHTVKSQPWRIKTAVAFTDRQPAIAFERYLKSASGRAFARKRL